jgi:malate synthase
MHQWVCDACPTNLQKRFVEITTPPMRKQVVNALNSGADVFMADFEDGLSPTWPNIIGGHHTLIKALKRNLRFYDSDTRKEYSVMAIHSQVFIQPRHLKREEHHVLVDNVPISASIFDVTVYAFHNYSKLISDKLGN